MVKGEGFPGNGNVGSKFLLGSLVIPLVYNMLEFTIGYVMDILVLILVTPFR